ncbi:MAG: MBL fold metallo-hydrolase [Nitrospinaceae bacterium]|nr:MBL fold metallo-hydrolase [Nitrospinaceae bacterium]NIR54369.1 MBL fold metallo-hydrolase [Nitrospinaceae bacterium]NIS84787.1 MBL fold metallo-hydrolase [Nitrospinaceae bacterium]NIT81588.1 MBL fold metallo-hydrolase [Nitrospinaceae bacterium]NIU43872.1 MBL fold metallo-hydrolase [Nitrospinaceae bacterium]
MPETTVTEVAPDVYRLCTFIPDFSLQFCQFLVKDDEPLLFHTGMKGLFPLVREAVASVIDPATLRWIGFSHFEADECGALNEWLDVAPNAQAACGMVAALVSVNDFASRPARILEHDEVLETGKSRFRYRATPQVPHGWDAGMLFEETRGALFCSDLFHQLGDVDAVTEEDLVERFRTALVEYGKGPFAHYMPYTPNTQNIYDGLAALKPNLLLPMHGSSWKGDGARAIHNMAAMMKEELGAG